MQNSFTAFHLKQCILRADIENPARLATIKSGAVLYLYFSEKSSIYL